MVELKHILEKCRLMLEMRQLAFAIEMTTLKLLNDQFEMERMDIRNDFLVRGICMKEVDGLMEEPSYYQMKFIPKHARWNYLKNEKDQLAQCIQKALTDLTSSYDKKWDLENFTIANIINILDLYQFTGRASSKRELEIQQMKTWMKENKVNSKQALLFNAYSELLK